MSSLRSHHWIRVALVIVALVMANGCAESESVPEPISETTAGGGVIAGGIDTIDSLVAANAGRWVMVNVWATWCRPCVAETPDLVAFANEMHDQPFTLIGLSADYFTASDTTAVRKVTEFQKKHNVPYTNLVFIGSTDQLTKHLDLSGVLPTTIIFDPSGKVADQYIGLIEKPDLEYIARQVRGA